MRASSALLLAPLFALFFCCTSPIWTSGVVAAHGSSASSPQSIQDPVWDTSTEDRSAYTTAVTSAVGSPSGAQEYKRADPLYLSFEENYVEELATLEHNARGQNAVLLRRIAHDLRTPAARKPSNAPGHWSFAAAFWDPTLPNPHLTATKRAMGQWCNLPRNGPHVPTPHLLKGCAIHYNQLHWFDSLVAMGMFLRSDDIHDAMSKRRVDLVVAMLLATDDVRLYNEINRGMFTFAMTGEDAPIYSLTDAALALYLLRRDPTDPRLNGLLSVGRPLTLLQATILGGNFDLALQLIDAGAGQEEVQEAIESPLMMAMAIPGLVPQRRPAVLKLQLILASSAPLDHFTSHASELLSHAVAVVEPYTMHILLSRLRKANAMPKNVGALHMLAAMHPSATNAMLQTLDAHAIDPAPTFHSLARFPDDSLELPSVRPLFQYMLQTGRAEMLEMALRIFRETKRGDLFDHVFDMDGALGLLATLDTDT